jgi:hypothetical protein
MSLHCSDSAEHLKIKLQFKTEYIPITNSTDKISIRCSIVSNLESRRPVIAVSALGGGNKRVTQCGAFRPFKPEISRGFRSFVLV